jgi:hypothetical protein
MDKIKLKIVLEVDENQHKSYACECEVIRMVQIYQDFGGIPILFIRFNPDLYIDNLGNKHDHESSDNRRKHLFDLLRGLDNRIALKETWDIPLSVMYVFYDGYNNIPSIQKIDYENYVIIDI